MGELVVAGCPRSGNFQTWVWGSARYPGLEHRETWGTHAFDTDGVSSENRERAYR